MKTKKTSQTQKNNKNQTQIPIEAEFISESYGSCKWLSSQTITARFLELSDLYSDPFHYRVALLRICNEDIIVGLHGASLNTAGELVRACGIHRVPLILERFKLPIFGFQLTPAAIDQLNDMASIIYNKFEEWIENDAEDVVYSAKDPTLVNQGYFTYLDSHPKD
jgi:hypothetical protein